RDADEQNSCYPPVIITKVCEEKAERLPKEIACKRKRHRPDKCSHQVQDEKFQRAHSYRSARGRNSDPKSVDEPRKDQQQTAPLLHPRLNASIAMESRCLSFERDSTFDPRNEVIELVGQSG